MSFNALAAEKSPYLRQHADNPVDWLPWGEAAFAKARAEQKPIFLSIGYSTCHWCHVMAHESFEDEATAALLNDGFVAIKVDREERPDVDRVYMAYVQAMTGHGGWPMSVWLTPELKPFFGGTYFPPEDRGNRAGFPSLLKAITNGWANERDKLVNESERVLGTLRDYHAGQAERGGPAGDLHEEAGAACERAFLQLYEGFDPEHGGFGGAPKFPRASNLNFLFRVAVIQGIESETGREAVKLATETLRHMAEGGIRDQVGGGFHRYSVDEAWFVPHFEKMLYDQAQIAVNYLDAYLFSGDERMAWVAAETLDWPIADLGNPAGGFYSALDADSRPHDAGVGAKKLEGAFYVWTPWELSSVLSPESATLVSEHFGLEADGNVPASLDPHGELAGRNVLRQTRSLAQTAAAHGITTDAAAEVLAGALAQLRVARAARPAPHRDGKVITAWNGLMLSALARAVVSPAECMTDKRDAYLDSALRTAEFIERELYDAERGVLYRAWLDGRGESEGFAEDYAFLIAGLLDLYEATWDARWLRWADRLQETMDALFWDEVGGGYFTASAGDPHIVLRLKEDYDGAEPAASSVAASNLARLAGALRDPARIERARRTVLALRGQWMQTPQALPELLTSFERVLGDPAQVVLAGDPAAADFKALATALRAKPTGCRTLLAATGNAWLLQRAPWIGDFVPVDGKAAAYVCEHYTCQAPVTDPAGL